MAEVNYHLLPLADWEVRAFLDGRKTQVRRVIRFPLNKPHLGRLLGEWPLSHVGELCDGILQYTVQTDVDDDYDDTVRCPFGQPRDLLWGQECWADSSQVAGVEDPGVVYRATDPDWSEYAGWKWRPSTTMPRRASRLTLEVVDVRAERVQEISPADCVNEGVEGPRRRVLRKPISPYDKDRHELRPANPIPTYAGLFDSTHADRGLSFAANPWVWVGEVRRVNP